MIYFISILDILVPSLDMKRTSKVIPISSCMILEGKSETSDSMSLITDQTHGIAFARPMRSDIRRSGIDGLKEKGSGIVRDDEEDETVPPHRRLYTQVEIDAQAATFESDDEDTEPYQQPLTNVNREPSMDANEQPPLKRSRSDDKQSILRSDEKITKKGWIKKKTRQMPLRISSQNVPIKPAEKNKGPQAWMAKPVQALAGFRVNLSMLRYVFWQRDLLT